MELIVDANVLFSALIKNSFNAKILFDYNFKFYTPEFLFVELDKYIEYIEKKTSRD